MGKLKFFYCLIKMKTIWFCVKTKLEKVVGRRSKD